MRCFDRKLAYYYQFNDNDKPDVKFGHAPKHIRDLPDYVELRVSCKKCRGCRMAHSATWAVRCMHEASLYGDNNSFITLTYDDENLPRFGNLHYPDFQAFMKRLRYHFRDTTIRFFMAGEYGSSYGRPHFHAILFNVTFDDLVLHSDRRGHRLYTSEFLSSIWKKGLCSVGSVTFESAGYVARYCLKKSTDEDTYARYRFFNTPYIDMDTGETFTRRDEFTNMSKKPGIGYDYYKSWTTDIYPDDFIIVKPPGKSRSFKVKVPDYYDKLFEIDCPDEYAILKAKRMEHVKPIDDPVELGRVQKAIRKTIEFKTKNHVRELD